MREHWEKEIKLVNNCARNTLLFLSVPFKGYLHWCLEHTAGRFSRFLQPWWRLTWLAGTIHLALTAGSVLHEFLVVGNQSFQRWNLVRQWFLFQVYKKKHKNLSFYPYP